MLKNMRGIFNVSLVRSILMRMIYNRHYASIDKNLGARKGKSGLMNIFVAYSILNDMSCDSSQDPISVKIFDFTQMYDSLVLQKCINRIYENGFDCEDLLLVVEANKKITMTVKNGDIVSKKQLFITS